MDEYGKKYAIYHAIEGGLIPKFDKETQDKIKRLVDMDAISINFQLRAVKMTNTKVGLENMSDDEILELLSIASEVGKQFQNHGWVVRY